ncbi:hypothetical protein LSH36_700g00002 [Paralvinella palmiformis]|uniref:Uncharacterized protein n=1 Tax=Paralvinella palmiformis TaxID=53620 RepID=A0AAD9J2I2_9ANNE|nr:hypothetical protein LSH36_700g00002 [Paralvinella palmiformis]
MTIMFSLFVVSHFPMPIAITADPSWRLSHWIYLPLLVINWFSSSVSWIVYTITHTGFRTAILKRIKYSPVVQLREETTHNPER